MPVPPRLRPPAPPDHSPSLTALGWDPDALGRDGTTLGAALAAHAGAAAARVLAVDRGGVDAVTVDGPVCCAVPPGLRGVDPAQALTTGDWVAVRPGADDRPSVAARLPRRTTLSRLGPDESSREQLLAANVDLVAVVEALDPEPSVARIERLLVLAWSSGARPLVVLTKADLVPMPDVVADEVGHAAPGAEVVLASAVTGRGVDHIRGLLGTGTMVLVGRSGSGKSSLLNALAGAGLAATAPVRSDGKGRHTTVRRELVPLPGGGVVLDTPGLRGVGLSVDEDALAATFGDIEDLAAGCRFTDCAHDTEPGCAVTGAVAGGELAADRLLRWRKLQREVRWQTIRRDARLLAEERNRWKRIHRSARGISRP